MFFRFIFLIGGFVFLYGVLVFNLYSIQIRKGDLYIARAESQLASGGLLATRGTVYFSDRDGSFVAAALDKEFFEVYAVPNEIKYPKDLAKIISPIIGEGVDRLTKRLSKENDQYELLIDRASKTEVEELMVGLDDTKGIHIRPDNERFYPLGSVSSHLLGYVSGNIESDVPMGRYGVENYFEDRLAGENGRVEGDKVRRAVPGGDVYLTIDRNIQSQAEEVLSRLVTDYRASGGTVIVQEPQTGRVLAMASNPVFDPNHYSRYPIKNFLNPAVQSIYEPGSIFKVLTMAAGIDSGKITPETVYTDTGSVTLNGETIRNWDLKAHGRQTMTNVIEQSLNTGTVFAEETMGHDNFLKYLESYGLNGLTGISLPGEVAGSLGQLKDKPKDINFATASFGQGISMTPFELLRAVGAIANKGVMMKPILEVNEQPQPVSKVFSASTASQVTDMMVSAVDKAVIAHIPGYTIAGKTGTAQLPDFSRGGYTDEVINTYIGFGPTKDPRFIILVKMDAPEGAPLAGQTIVPAFKELAQFVINYYNIAPDRLEE